MGRSIFSLMFFFIFSLCSQASTENLLNKKIAFAGTSSIHGDYEGEMELREGNGTIKVTRIMTYKTFQFEDLSIQEVWTGNALYDDASDDYIISYDLSKADFLKSAEGLVRNDADFKEKLPVEQKLSLRENAIASKPFFRSLEKFCDTYLKVTPAGEIPLWENKRVRIESKGHESSRLLHFMNKLLEWKLFNWLHSQAFSLQYEKKEDFLSKKQFMVYDPTDFEFYQKHPDILRVINKIPDTLSFIEEIQRRNAYAFSLEEKMHYYDLDMMDFHLNEFGLFSGAHFNLQGRFEKYALDGDASLWTGMYLASMAMKYKITHEEQALSQMKKSLNGLMLLMDITGNDSEFARSIIKYDEAIKLGDSFHRGLNQNADKIWLSGGNNDMFKGLIHGFIWAYMTLPASETLLREKLLQHMARLPNLAIAKKIQGKAAAFGLKALATKSPEDLKLFIKNFSKEIIASKLLNIEGAVHIGGIADWSGVNLGMVSTLTNILIAQNLNQQDVATEAKKDLALLWKDFAGTKRDFLTIATYTFAIKDGLDLREANELNDGYTDDDLLALWRKDLKNSLWSLREIPINRSKYDTTYDYSLKPSWCLSWWPRLPWKSFFKKMPAEFHYQSVDSYPLFEGPGLGSNFIWKDQPFGFTGGSSKNVRMAGADYLYTYWMARLSGLINNGD